MKSEISSSRSEKEYWLLIRFLSGAVIPEIDIRKDVVHDFQSG
jgi:hypothetical protein